MTLLRNDVKRRMSFITESVPSPYLTTYETFNDKPFQE